MKQEEAIEFKQILVTEAAQNHFYELIQKEEIEGMNLRISVANPGTVHADVSITFCPADEQLDTDSLLPLKGFNLFIDKVAESALRSATIDFQPNELGGQLSIKAPYLKGQLPKEDSPLRERIQYVLDAEINPMLAMHRGEIKLVDILSEKIIVLEFGGGCHGCGMATVTLKQGVEKTLRAKFPEIVEIRDITDHATGKNPYY